MQELLIYVLKSDQNSTLSVFFIFAFIAGEFFTLELLRVSVQIILLCGVFSMFAAHSVCTTLCHTRSNSISCGAIFRNQLCHTHHIKSTKKHINFSAESRFSNGFKHHGTCWGEQDELDPCVIHLNVSKGGIYNIMVTVDRNDLCATTMCPQEVEYIPKEPEDPPPPFPTV